MQMNAFMEAQQAENRKCMEQMSELHRVSVAATTATQAKLDALVRAVTDLPEGAQVLRNVFDPPATSSALASGTPETASTGKAEQESTSEPDAPSPPVGAPPSPEHSNGLEEEHEPLTQPTTISPPGTTVIATHWTMACGRFASMMRNGTASSPRGLTRSPLRECPPGLEPYERGLETASMGPVDAPPRLRARLPMLDRHATNAYCSGPTSQSADATPVASEPDQAVRTVISPADAAPGTPPAASPEGNAALRQERTLLLDAIRIRRAHLLRTLELERVRWNLAVAACDRTICLPDHEMLLRHAPTGLEPGPCAERAFTRAAQLHFQDRQTPPQRHPDDPADPCGSFSTVSSPEERNRSHARIVWAVAALDEALDRSGDARSLPTTDRQKPNTSSSSTLEKESGGRSAPGNCELKPAITGDELIAEYKSG